MRLRAGEPDAEGVRVFLDGRELFDCTEADDVEGWADVIAADGSGRPISGGGLVRTYRLAGTVEFKHPQP